MSKKWLSLVVVLAVLLAAVPVHGSVVSKGIREAAEFLGKKFAKEAAEEGAERLTAKMAKLAATHGDDVVVAAFKIVGPRAGRVAGEAAEPGLALKLLARHGDDAIPIVTKATSLKAVAHFGDDAAEAIIKHGAVAEELLERFAGNGAKALAKVKPQNARRLAMMAGESELNDQLVSVVARYGDEACDFIWRNKAALAVGAVLTAFVASPEPFLNGTQQLVTTVAEKAVKPLAEVPKEIAKEAARGTNWTLLILIAAAVGGFLFLERRWNAGHIGRLLNQFMERLRK